MATIIPRANPAVPQISSLPQVRNTAQVQAPSGMASAVAGVTGAAMGLVQQHKERADLTALMQARKELSDEETSLFDPANDSGVYSYKGKNALDAGNQVRQRFDKRVAEIGARLTPDQRQKFDQIALSSRESILGRVQNYAGQEYRQWEEADRKASLASVVNTGANAALDGDEATGKARLAEAMQMQDMALQSDGASDAMRKDAARGLVSAYHAQVISGLIAKDPRRAQEYYDRNEETMSAEARARALGELRPFAEDADADEAAGNALAGVHGVVRDPGPRGQPSPAVRAALDDAAKEAGLDAHGRAVLYALAEQESGFNPGAVNREVLDDGDQATGLFQYRQTSADAAGLKDRKNAQESARVAARELADRIKRGGVDFAIAAHFGGEGGAEAVVQHGESLKNPRTARYLEQVRGRAVRWQSQLGGAAGAADTTAERQSVTLAPPQTEGEALERVRNDPTLTNPRVRKLAEQKVREQWSQREQDKADLERNTREAINAAVWSGDPKRSLREILGPEQYGFAAQKGMLGELSRDLLLRREGGDATRTDNKAVVGAYLSTLRSNPRAFATMDVMKNARHMSPKTADELLKLQEQVRAGKFDHDEYATEGEQLKALVFAPMGATGDSEDAKKKRVDFEAQWFQTKRDYVAATGKKPNAEQREGLIRKLTATVLLNGDEVPLYKADGKPVQVPDAERAQIVDALTRKGRTPDEATILRLYLQRVGSP